MEYAPHINIELRVAHAAPRELVARTDLLFSVRKYHCNNIHLHGERYIYNTTLCLKVIERISKSDAELNSKQ